MTTNLLSMPSYSHLNFISADFYASHTGTSAEFKITGTDDAFGDHQKSTITTTMAEAKERKMKLIGKINAFDITYPQSLQIKITGFDNAGAGSQYVQFYEGDMFLDPTGDFRTEEHGKGFVCTSPDGLTRKRIYIDNAGNVATVAV